MPQSEATALRFSRQNVVDDTLHEPLLKWHCEQRLPGNFHQAYVFHDRWSNMSRPPSNAIKSSGFLSCLPPPPHSIVNSRRALTGFYWNNSLWVQETSAETYVYHRPFWFELDFSRAERPRKGPFSSNFLTLVQWGATRGEAFRICDQLTPMYVDTHSLNTVLRVTSGDTEKWIGVEAKTD